MSFDKVKRYSLDFFLIVWFFTILNSANGSIGIFIIPVTIFYLVVRTVSTFKNMDSVSYALFLIGLIYLIKGLFEFTQLDNYNIEEVIDLLTFYTLFLLIGFLYISSKHLSIHRIRRAVLGVIIVLFFDGLIEFLLGYSILRGENRDNIRVHSIFLENHYGSYMFFLYVLFSVLNHKVGQLRYMDLIVGCLVIVATVMAVSRLPFLLTVTLLSIQVTKILFSKEKGKLSVVLYVIFICVISIWLAFSWLDYGEYSDLLYNYLSLDNINREQSTRRYSIWLTSLCLIGNNPLLGINQLEFTSAAQNLCAVNEMLVHPHSVFLEFLLYSGILLFILVYFFIGGLVYVRSKAYGLVLYFYTIPIIGPGSTSNASWMMILAISIALLISSSKRIQIKSKFININKKEAL